MLLILSFKKMKDPGPYLAECCWSSLFWKWKIWVNWGDFGWIALYSPPPMALLLTCMSALLFSFLLICPKVAYVLICYIFSSTIIYVLQGTSGYKVHLPNLAQKLKKSTGKALLMNNFESVIASKQSMMHTCFKHKGKCCLAVTWKSGNMQWICSSWWSEQIGAMYVALFSEGNNK